MKTLIEQISLWGAIIGATLLAINISISGWAYVPFLLSNVASFYLLNKIKAPKVLILQSLFFVFINIIGIIRWL